MISIILEKEGEDLVEVICSQEGEEVIEEEVDLGVEENIEEEVVIEEEEIIEVVEVEVMEVLVVDMRMKHMEEEAEEDMDLICKNKQIKMMMNLIMNKENQIEDHIVEEVDLINPLQIILKVAHFKIRMTKEIISEEIIEADKIEEEEISEVRIATSSQEPKVNRIEEMI